MSLGVSFRPGGEGLGGEWIIEIWVGLRMKFGQGFRHLKEFSLVAMSMGGPFGSFGIGLIMGWGWEIGRT